MADRPTSPLLRSSAKVDWSKGEAERQKTYGAGKDQQYSVTEIADMPSGVLLSHDIWKKADQIAQSVITQRRIELVAQSYSDNPAGEMLVNNMTALAKQYPSLDPDALIGMASGWAAPLADPDTPATMSDQGEAERQMFNEVHVADVMSAAQNGTFGATSANPFPTLPNDTSTGGLSALQAGAGQPELTGMEGAVGETLVPMREGTEYVEEAPDTSLWGQFKRDFTNPVGQAKRTLNSLQNVLRASPEIANATTEVSYGNEAKAAELARRADMTEEQARALFGDRGLPDALEIGAMTVLGPLAKPLLGRYSTDIDPAKLTADIEHAPDDTIPIGDITYEQAKDLWQQHLQETEQITETGDRSFGSITGRTTLGQQNRTATLGEGGWFGGAPPDVENRSVRLAERQSDMRTFEQREASRKKADAYRQMYTDAGMEMDLDKYTTLLSVRPYTEGRATTAWLGMSPNSIAEKTLSGAIDLVATLAQDPATYIPANAPSGIGKAAVAGITRGRFFGVDDAVRRSGEAIEKVGEDFSWIKQGREFVLADETGAVVPNTPRLQRTGFHYEADTGHRVVRNGRMWEVHTPEYLADPQNAPAPAQFATKKAAEDSLVMPTKKREQWAEAGGTSGNPTTLQEAQNQALTDYARSVGVSPRPVLASRHVWNFLNNERTGGQFVNAVVDNDDAYDILLRSNFQFSVDEASKLAQARTAAEVRAVAAERFGPDQSFAEGLSNFIGAKGRYTDAKIRLADANKVSAIYRFGSLAPKGIPIRLDDLDDAVAQAHAIGTAMGLKPDDMRAGINEMIRQGGGKASADYMQDTLLKDVFKRGLLGKGVKPERVDRLMNMIRKEKPNYSVRPDRAESRRGGVPRTEEDIAAQALETRMGGGPMLDTAIPDGQFLTGLDDEVALFAQEVLGTHIIMPSVRDIRREVSRVAKMMHRNSDEGDDFYDRVAKASSGFLDMWRNLTLMNNPYITRSIIEEAFSMSIRGRNGLMNRPVEALATILMGHYAQEYSSGFRFLTKAKNKAKAALGAERAARLRPEEYRNTKMVETGEVMDALGLQPQQFDKAVGKSGFEVSWNRFLRQTRQGIIDPIEVVVDYSTGRVGLGKGQRRLQAAVDNGLDSVPVKVTPGRVADDAGVPLSDATLLARTQRRKDIEAGATDVRHDDIFVPDRIVGDFGDVVSQARAAVNDSIAYRAGMKYIWPRFQGTLGRINGDTYMRDIEEAVRFGDNSRITRSSQLLTRLNGSALMDEHPNKVLRQGGATVEFAYDANGKIDWTEEASRKYIRSVSDSLADIAAVREVREILDGRSLDDIVEEVLDDPDRLQDIMGVLENGVRESVGRAGANIPQGMTPDAMINYHLQQMQGAPAEAVRSYFQSIMAGVSRHLGNNSAPRIREVITQGQYAGKSLGSRNKKFVEFLKEEADTNPDWVAALPPKIAPFDSYSERMTGKIVTGFFNIAGNMRDMITLNPLMREVYTDEVVRLGKYLTPEDHAKALKNLRDIGDERLARRFERTRNPDGWMDLETAEKFADDTARRTAEDEFYHAMNRNNWAVALRWASPFAQAAANTTRRWGRSLIKDPLSVYRTTRNIEAFEDSIGEYVAGGNDPEGLQDAAGVQGWLDQNQYGEEMFVYPLVGMLGGFVGNALYRGLADDNAESVVGLATHASTDLFQNGIIGTGPVVNFLLGMTPLRALEARPDMIGDVIRFFEPFGSAQGNNLVEGALDAFVPAKLIGLVMKDDKMINQMSTAIMLSRLSNGEYGPMSEWDKNTSEKIRADVNRDARTLITLEAIGKLGLPLLGGFSFSPLIKMPDDMNMNVPEGVEGVGYLLPHMLKAEYSNYMEGAKTFEEQTNRKSVFLRDWGDFAQFLQYGTTESVSGMTYSNPAAADFAREEPGLYQEYRDSIGYLLPGGDWNAEWDAFDRSLREQDKANGVIRERTTAEQWEFLRQKALSWQKQQERKEAELGGASYAQVKAIDDKYERLGLHSENSAWVERHLAQLETIVNDPRVTDSIDTAKYVRDYLAMRRQAKEALRGQEYDSFSSDYAHNDPTVRWLYGTGSKAAADDPGFANFWENIAVKEFIGD